MTSYYLFFPTYNNKNNWLERLTKSLLQNYNHSKQFPVYFSAEKAGTKSSLGQLSFDISDTKYMLQKRKQSLLLPQNQVSHRGDKAHAKHPQ